MNTLNKLLAGAAISAMTVLPMAGFAQTAVDPDTDPAKNAQETMPATPEVGADATVTTRTIILVDPAAAPAGTMVDGMEGAIAVSSDGEQVGTVRGAYTEASGGVNVLVDADRQIGGKKQTFAVWMENPVLANGSVVLSMSKADFEHQVNEQAGGTSG